MKTIDRRIGKLDHQFGTAAGKPQYLLAVCRASWGPMKSVGLMRKVKLRGREKLWWLNVLLILY